MHIACLHLFQFMQAVLSKDNCTDVCPSTIMHFYRASAFKCSNRNVNTLMLWVQWKWYNNVHMLSVPNIILWPLLYVHVACMLEASNFTPSYYYYYYLPLLGGCYVYWLAIYLLLVVPRWLYLIFGWISNFWCTYLIAHANFAHQFSNCG